MAHILTGILSLGQHLLQLSRDPQSYRPPFCLHCHSTRLWQHGFYYRKADRLSADIRINQAIMIPRFFCPSCRKTCSSLPECIPPRRWYLWSLQQAVLADLLNGHSLNEVCKRHLPCRQTCRRWWLQLQSRFVLHADSLRSQFVALGRLSSFKAFWQGCLDKMPLSKAMYLLHQDGVNIP